MRSLAVALLLVPSLAGCLGADGPVAPSAAPAAQPPALPYVGVALVCPPGETVERVDDVCIGTLASLTESLQEPYLAIHPGKPQLLVIGVNSGEAGRAVSPLAGPSPAEAMRSRLFLTEDAGVSWRELDLPRVEPPSPGVVFISGDSTPLFGADGTLHFTGIIVWANADQAGRLDQTVYYIRSTDNGQTWSEPHFFSTEGDDDRNWMTLGPDGTVYVSWQAYRGAATSHVAWTRNAGSSWDAPDGGLITIEDCRPVSNVAIVRDEALVSCTRVAADGFTELDVYRLDLANQTAQLAGATGIMGVFGLLATSPDGSLFIAPAESGDGPQLGVSRDAGRTWSDPIDVLDAITNDDAWDFGLVMALSADPWGGVHLLLEGGSLAPCTRVPPCQTEDATRQVVHAVFDARTLELVSEATLTPDAMAEPRAPPAAAPAWFDDFHTIGFAPDHGLLVWAYDKGLDYTRVEPRAPSEDVEGIP